ncbi:MAG: thioredoxin family protein [Flavobacteriales bacterium CG_4_9_14_3_um_filter_40_17]|nr:MAG: thioredoxin family protein [Flavobacteriales bacterium CG_4_9_14_3_um_filter_40_17]
MNIETQIELSSIIEQSLEKSMSYKEYRILVQQLLEENESTGNTQSESLLNYSQLNDRRMHRWDKTLRVPEDIERKIKKFDKEITWLVIAESWCGDAAHVLPVINKMTELNSNINLRIVIRDENMDLMNQFLTNGSQSIPKLIVLQKDTLEVLTIWGPRPSNATKMVEDYKKEHGSLDTAFKEDLQMWYNKDKGINIMQDLVFLLEKF